MTLVVIVGATGTGKSDLSLSVAEGLSDHGMPAEIVNADAMQLYRGMDVGTAKLTIGSWRTVASILRRISRGFETARLVELLSAPQLSLGSQPLPT